MVRRFGTLGAGALLTFSLVTGCVATSDYAEQPSLYDARTQPTPPRPAVKSTPPRVSEPAPRNPQAYLEPPPPPPPPEIEFLSAKAALPEPLPVLPPARVAHGSSEENEPPVLIALRCFLENRQPEAAAALQHCDQPSRDMLLALLPFAARLSEGGLERASPREVAALRDKLEPLLAALRVPLSVEKMCYCRRISDYGMYDPLPEDHAFAGGDRRHGELVQLYVEARNFTNRQNGKVFETSLASKLEIYDARGELVARMDFPAKKPDHCLSPRHDYFIHYQFYVPAKMEAGDYTLTLSLRDENAATNPGPWPVQRSLKFHVGDAATAHAAR